MQADIKRHMGRREHDAMSTRKHAYWSISVMVSEAGGMRPCRELVIGFKGTRRGAWREAASACALLAGQLEASTPHIFDEASESYIFDADRADEMRRTAKSIRDLACSILADVPIQWREAWLESATATYSSPCGIHVTVEQIEVAWVRINREGYDDTGAYWGSGPEVCQAMTHDGRHEATVRRKSLAVALDEAATSLSVARALSALSWIKVERYARKHGAIAA